MSAPGVEGLEGLEGLEDPEALVAEPTDLVLEEAGAKRADAFSSRGTPPTTRAGDDVRRSAPAARCSEGVSDVSDAEANRRARRVSLFRGGDAFFLKHHPFGFLVELLARADAFEPGVLAAAGGEADAEAFARAVVFAAVRDAVAEARGASGARATPASIARRAASSPRLERTAWRTDALLAILRGDPFDAATVFAVESGADGAVRSATRNPKEASANDARTCLSRLSRRLFRAPFETVALGALRDGSDDARDARDVRARSLASPVEDSPPFGAPPFADDPLAFVPPAFDRSALPRRYEDALARFAEATCERCLSKPRDPAVCLVCGAVMCCADPRCAERRDDESGEETKRRRDARDAERDARALASAPTDVAARGSPSDAAFRVFEDAGACSAHASRRACGGGSCCFLLLKSTRVLILHSAGRRACLFPSPYVDAHGEEDEHVRRGRPLFLDEARVRLLETLWASGALEHDSRATGESRLGGEWF